MSPMALGNFWSYLNVYTTAKLVIQLWILEMEKY